MANKNHFKLIILNQMAGPITWELAVDLGASMGGVALMTGHPDTLAKAPTEGLTVIPAVPYDRAGYPRRVLSWLRYWVQTLFWVLRQPKETPLLLFTNPPLLAWLGLLLHGLRGQPFSVMVHDIYPDVLVRLNGMPERNPVVRLWRWLNAKAYERAEVVMTLGENMADTLAVQFDAQKTKNGRVEVIYPWVDTETIRPIPKAQNWFAQEHGQVGKLTVMYSGNMGLGHDIETMLAAAQELRDVPDVHFMFIGAGPKWALVEKTLQQETLPNVTLLGWQPEETIPYSLATADIALVSLDKGMEGLAIPSKAIYAMAAGTAVVAIAQGQNELATWLERYACGEQVAPQNVSQFVGAIREFLENGRKVEEAASNARQTAQQLFTRQGNIQRLATLLK